MKRLRLLMTLCAIIAAMQIHAEDWPRFRGPNANGISRETNWNPMAVKQPRILWKKNVGVGHSEVVTKGNILCTMGNSNNKDTVFCLKISDGSKVWTFSYDCPGGNYAGPRSTPLIEDGCVYTMSRNGDVYCLDAAKGTENWHVNLMSQFGAKNLKWGFASSPVVSGNVLFLNANQWGIALDKKTGHKIWASPAGTGNYSTPVFYQQNNKPAVAMFGETALHGVDLKTGKKLWSYEWKTSCNVLAADPIIFNNKVFISSGYNKGAALIDISGTTPKELWTTKSMRNHFTSSILIDGYIYGVDGNTGKGRLVCLNPKDGTEKWAGADGAETLTAVGDKLLVLDKRGDLFVAKASPNSYSEIARGKVFNTPKAKKWTAPTLANGLLFCRDSDGEFICLNMK